MKKILALIVSIHLLYATSSTQTLVASYPFTGNANDVSGNNNNGTVFGATLTTDRFGNANSAYSFNGGTDNISAPDQIWLDLTTAFSVAGWIYPTATPPAINSGTAFTIASKDIAAGNNQRKWIFGLQNGALAFHINGPGLGSGEWVVSNTFSLPLNQWYYCVVTKNGSTVNFYMNGVSVGTATLAGTLLDPAGASLTIGYSEAGLSTTGKLDDINIYNNTLGLQQIYNNYVNDVKRPGSGNSLQFVRTNDVNTCPSVNIGNDYSFGSQDFTFEAWIKKDEILNVPSNLGRIIIVSESNNGWAVGLLNGGELFLSDVGNSGQGSGVVCIDPNDLNWHHIAVVYQSNNVKFYTDGILKSSVPYTASFNGAGDYSLGFRQSFKPFTEQNFAGRMDEVRIWKNIALSQSAIRNWMCRKINASHPAYSDLVGYFRCDEGSGASIGGYNGKFGTFVNSTSINWLTSAAPLGDIVAHDFVNATKTANITASTGENFSVTSTAGNPDGIVLYHINEAPNSNIGANNGGNNRYFGVFQSGGTSPQYTAVYNYDGNPLVNPGIESALRLAKRTDNAVTTWTLLSTLPNEPANTITVTGESTEYILGAIGSQLPVTLLNFAASKCNSSVCLLWTTENEQNFSHYEVEKSNDGIHFTKMSSVAALNLPQQYSYTANDNNPVNGANYYRLKQVNTDSRYTYSRVLKINLAKPQLVSVQPNPATHSIAIKGLNGYQQIRVLDINGKIQFQKTVQQSIEEINIATLPAGIYMLQAIKENEITTIKFLKQ